MLTLVVVAHKYNKKLFPIKFPSQNIRILNGRISEKTKFVINKMPHDYEISSI